MAISPPAEFAGTRLASWLSNVNLPTPQVISYPAFDETGTNFTGTFYNVEWFSG